MLVTVMLAFPGWTQEKVNNFGKSPSRTSWGTSSTQQIDLCYKLLFPQIPGEEPTLKTSKSELTLSESQQAMGEGEGLTCSAMKIGLVTRSDQPPCIWLEQINEWNPSISASLVI